MRCRSREVAALEFNLDNPLADEGYEFIQDGIALFQFGWTIAGNLGKVP
jgi:hypothetical protein